MAAYKKISVLLLIIITLILFKSPLLANNNEVNCFPFKEEWGISTEEFKKTYKYTGMVETDGEVFYGNELNLYGEKITVGYTFHNNALTNFGYFSSQRPETWFILFKNLEQSLKCLFGEPSENVNVKKNGRVYLILWEKGKTTVFLSFGEILPMVVINFYDNSNPINKKSIEEHKIFIKRMKEYKEKEKKLYN